MVFNLKFSVDFGDYMLLEILQRMDIEEVAKMFFVCTRFNELIKKHPAVWINKKSTGTTVHLDIYKQPVNVLIRFFMIFGDCIKSLDLDDPCMFVAVKIVGYCPHLRRLVVGSAEMIAYDYLHTLLPNLVIILKLN